MKEENDFISKIKSSITESEEEKKSLENQIEELTKLIESLRVTYQFLLKEPGKEKRTGRFVNAKLGDALETLIKEHGTITVKELIKKLEAEGYEFKTKKGKKPRKPQTVKFALLNKSNIDRSQKNKDIYKWKENVAGEEI